MRAWQRNFPWSEKRIWASKSSRSKSPSTLRSSRAHRNLGQIYFSIGKLPEAIAELETMHRLDGNGTYGLEALGFIHARAGRTNEAQKLLRQLLELQRQGLDYRVGIALVQQALGDDGLALDSLDMAFAERAFGLERLNADPYWNGLRPNARVQAILRKMNLMK